MSAAPSPFGRIETLMATVRTTLINLGFFAALLLLVPAVASQAMRNAVVIDPIAVPKALADRGLTAEVMANRLWDGLRDFSETASAARATIAAIPDSQLVEFSLPDTGISLDSIFAQIRLFFNIHETRIGGEVICETPACAPEGMRLRLRILRGGSDIVDLPPLGAQDEAAYLRDAAAGIFEVLDPFVAIAALSHSEPDRAALLARQLIARGGADAKWAHNLIGDIARRAGTMAEAAEAYRAALAIDGGFDSARIGLGLALTAMGDHAGAHAAFAEVAARDPDNLDLLEGLTGLALAEGDDKAAIAALRRAADAADRPAPYLARAGAIALDGGDRETGVALLSDALLLDPSNELALRRMAGEDRRRRDLAAAEALYRNWVGYDPQSVDAHVGLADLLVDRYRSRDALAPYAEALRLDPDQPGVRLRFIRALIAANQLARARDVLDAARAHGNDPAFDYFDAEILAARGRTAEARSAYQRYLFRAPTGPYAGLAELALKDMD